MSARRRSCCPRDQAENLLKERSRRLTGPRKAVLKILACQHHPVSAAEIHKALGRAGVGCDLATIYRSIRLLETHGIAHRYDLGDGVARYELIRQGGPSHHHHLVCTRCSEVVEIKECAIHEMQESIAVRNGFKSVSHRLEFFGICPDCQ